MIARNDVLALFLFWNLWPCISQATEFHGINSFNRLPKNKSTRVFPPITVGVYGGMTQFFGELNEQDMKSLFGIGAGIHVSRIVSLNLDYTVGKLGGQKRTFLNSYFINEYNTYELTCRWSVSRQFNKNQDDLVDFGLYGGVGLMIFSANAFNLQTGELVRYTNSKLSARNPLFLRWGTPHGPVGIDKTNEGILPIGMNIEYGGKSKLRVGIDFRFYFIRSDKADATSGQRLVNPEEADSYSETPNDKCSFIAISLKYRFSKRRSR